MVILYILLVLVAVILARTMMFTPKKTEDRERPPDKENIQRRRPSRRLSENTPGPAERCGPFGGKR